MKPKPSKNASDDRVKIIERELPMWHKKLSEALQWEKDASTGGETERSLMYHYHAKNISDRIIRMQSELEALTSQK